MTKSEAVTTEIAGALARFWAGGSGPSHSSVSASFAFAGYEEPPEDGKLTKQERVLKAVRNADGEVALRLVEELLGLLRNADEFDRSPNPPKTNLLAALERAGHSLTNGYINWHSEEGASIELKPPKAVSSPQPPRDQVTVLASILDVFRSTGSWPTYEYIDSIMDKQGLHLDEVLSSMPRGWFFPDNRVLSGVFFSQPQEKLGLTILGVYRCPEVHRLLALFLKGVIWGVKERNAHTPSPTEYTEPEWTLSTFTNGLGRPLGNGEVVDNDILLILDLMRLEADLPRWSGPIDDPRSWKIHIPREIRRWSKLETIDEYVKTREDEILAITRTRTQTHGRKEQEMTAAPIFIVHGHDDGRKHEVARLLERLTKRGPVILHEQADQGQTIIEKFEKHASSAAFAVVLLTGDDVGGERGALAADMKRRARQNVVFELGYFVGAIGRRHVVALYETGVEIPSDLHGVLYTKLDSGGAWKSKLARELRASGIAVDPSPLLE